MTRCQSSNVTPAAHTPSARTRSNWAGIRHEVNAILSRWRLPDGPVFRVSTKTGQVFELSYREREDRWNIIVMPDASSRHVLARTPVRD